MLFQVTLIYRVEYQIHNGTFKGFNWIKFCLCKQNLLFLFQFLYKIKYNSSEIAYFDNIP